MFSNQSKQRLCNRLALILFIFSFGALLAAFSIEHLFDMTPCKLCLWQRITHALTAFFALIALSPATSKGLFLRLSITVLFIGGCIALYQYGIEWRWWENNAGCTTTPSLESIDHFETQLLNNAKTPCDIKGPSFLGITLSGFNALFSFFLTSFSVTFLYKLGRKQ